MLPYMAVAIKNHQHKKETAMHQLIKPREKQRRLGNGAQMYGAKGKNK